MNTSEAYAEKAASNLKIPAKQTVIGNKVPPHSLEAEIAVLGAMMVDEKAVPKVISILEIDSFYNPQNRIIYSTMISMFQSSKRIDVVTLHEELLKRGALQKAGGSFYIAQINDNTPTSANVEAHAFIVQERFLKRKLINIAGEIVEKNYDETSDALENIDEAEKKIFEIAEKRFKKGAVSMRDLSKSSYDLILQMLEKGGSGLTGVESGFYELDKYTGGFQNSDLIIIAARPSQGKTALGLSLARNIITRKKPTPMAFFSIEMSAHQLVIRLLSSEARINMQSIRTGQLNRKEHDKVVSALEILSSAPLYIDDSPMLSITELRAKCRRLKAECEIGLVMVDYLQLMHAAKAESREREISMISQGLKQIAKELNIPVIALAQLNRGIEGRKGKPMLSDLRESGSIEQDADMVIFINRPEVYGQLLFDDDKTPTEGMAEIIIGKQRNGPTATVRLAFQKDFARFENFAYMQEPNMPYQDEVSPF